MLESKLQQLLDPYEQTDRLYMDKQDYEDQKRTKYDPVSAPIHYVGSRSIEPINVIVDWQLGFCLGNALKYISRAGRKGDKVEDLKKAIWYLEKEIENVVK